MIGRHHYLISVRQGRVNETDTYTTIDTQIALLARYTKRYEPEPGQYKPGQCIVVKKMTNYFVFRQTC